MADSASTPPSTPAPAEPPAPAPATAAGNQAGVDELIAQVQAGNAAAGDTAKAMQDAAAAAQDIAAVAQSVAPANAGAAPAGAVAGDMHAVSAPPMAEMPVLASAFETSHDPFISSPELQRLLAIEVPLIVQLGTRRMSVGEVMRFAVGAIIEFNKAADEDLDLLVNNRHIGKGQAVKVGENFGIKLSSIAPVRETILKLGGA